MSKYLLFVRDTEREQREGRKTQVWLVRSKSHGVVTLAEIRWFGRWRQYALFPYEGMVFNQECLNDIREKLLELMSEWGRTMKARKT